MLYLEETVDAILSEEGQTLMGLDFLTDTLGLTMKKMELLFKKSVLEYSKRRPIKETKEFNAINVSTEYALLTMPENTLSVRAVRYGVLPSIPRFYLPTFGEISYEFEKHNLSLKVWPPIAPLKITYTRGYAFTKEIELQEKYYCYEGDDVIYDVLPCTYRENSLTIVKNNVEMKELSRDVNTFEENGVTREETVVTLSGNLGTGTINLNTREFELDLTDTTAGYIYFIFKPQYKVIKELDLGDFVFTKLFALKILEALASLRAQATQTELHNVDLTTDELYSRVRILKREVDKLLKSTQSISSMLPL